MTQPRVPIGTIRCMECGKRYDDVPPNWDCVECGGPVSQKMGEIHMPARYVPPTDGQPADIEEAPEVEYEPLPFDLDELDRVLEMKHVPKNAPVRCSECQGSRGFHKTNCPLYRP